ncbi:hypothetical protein [Methylobacterium fujisawaense]|uniref:hypothetical protein n=1 Tax=Methylobacterium fujisawaense TaxID=107400 RepID=UPI00313F15D9
MTLEVPETLSPIFEQHAVSVEHRLFLYRAFSRLIEDSFEYPTMAGVVEHGILGADDYEELLQQHDRGHRQNKSWFHATAYSSATPTRKGRALLRDLVAANPDWRDHT